MSQAHDDLVARAQDPRTPLTTLHSLAQNYPGLRPAIARNPSTYPALLEWLGSLGDPAVDAALAARTATGESTVSLPPVVIPSRPRRHNPEAAAQRSTETTQRPASHTALMAAGTGGTATATTAAAAASSTTPRPAVGSTGPQTTTAQEPQSTGPEPQDTGYDSLELLRANASEDSGPSSTGDSMLPWIALAAAMIMLVTVMLIIFTSGGSTSPTQTTPTAPAATSAPAASPSTKASPAPTASTTPTPSAPPTTAAATATPSTRLVAPAPQDAVDLAAFTDPTGNITCQVSGQQASCSIKERSFAKEECPAGDSYKAAVEPGTSPYGACVPDFQPAPTTLETGKTTTQGDYACTVGTGEVRCWSQSTGQGFSLAADGATSIDLTQR